MNLRNLQMIGSRLSHELKVQLVHSCILSQIDYCNAVYTSLTEQNLQKLQKIQNDAVRFIFGIKGVARRTPISPYLKKLHFLPVRYRIKFKVALLVFKCVNNLAPIYLSSLLKLRNPKRRSVRLDDDYFLLNIPAMPHFKRTEGAFSISGPKIWNDLPYAIRCLSDLILFKKALKTFYFDLVYNDI